MVDSQPQYAVVRKIHTPSNGLLATGSIPLYFPVIPCAQQFIGVHLRTSQKRAPKPFNSCEPLRTFPITSRNRFRRFPNTSEDFPKISKNHKNIWKLLLNRFRSFPKISEYFRTPPKISEHFRRFPKIFRKFKKNLKTSGKHFWTVSEVFQKFHKSFKLLKNGFEAFPKF